MDQIKAAGGLQGIGVYWEEPDADVVDLDVPGLPTRVIQDASGTILLAEIDNDDDYAGSAVCSAILGPTNAGNQWASYQLVPPMSAPDGVGMSYGNAVYAAHGMKFNYLFHDNHVQLLSWQQTIGTTPIRDIGTGPYLGMWTIAPGD
jgi:hypothetical protein